MRGRLRGFPSSSEDRWRCASRRTSARNSPDRVRLARRSNAWSAPLRGVMAVIEQHVTQCPADLERRAQRPHVIATVEDFAAALKQPVRELADARTDALHPTGDRVVGVRFDRADARDRVGSSSAPPGSRAGRRPRSRKNGTGARTAAGARSGCRVSIGSSRVPERGRRCARVAGASPAVVFHAADPHHAAVRRDRSDSAPHRG